jgi:hypothetical protein
MTLMLHTGGEPVSYADLRALPVPAATASHVPIPHHALADMVKYSLGFFGHELLEEHHATTPDGMNYFGVLSLRSPYGDYTDMVGLRNSHKKQFPIGIAIGSRVFVCDNLAFNADHVIKRKHTANAKRDLPGLVAEVIEPLGEARKAQALMFERYKALPLHDELADQGIMTMYRLGIINLTRIGDVLKAYEEPPHDWGNKTPWRLFNAATFALNGRVAENPTVTSQLHQVIDGVCERIN